MSAAGGTAATQGGNPASGAGTTGSEPIGGSSSAGGSGEASQGAPTGLLCELLRHPERALITDGKPEFGFITSFAAQSAVQILVASSQQLLDSDQGDSWDSGKQRTDKSIDLEYAGAALEPGKTYYWKVRNWDAADTASAWSEAQQFTMAASLGAYSTPREPVEQTLVTPAKLTTLAPDHAFVDFGRDAFGWLELELDSKSAASITVRLGEVATGNAVNLTPGGSIRAASVQLQLQAGLHKYRVQTPKDTRNTSGDAVRLPAELGVVMPFRYAEVLGSPVPLEAAMLHQVAVHYPYEPAASAFSSSDDKLNQVWEISKYSMVAPTFAGVYIDGDRERIPYEGDAYIQQLGHYSVDREFALARYSHEYLLDHPTWPTEWKQHSVMMAWTDWMYTGNTEALARAYDKLVAEKTLESHVGADGLLNSSGLQDLVDWPEGERDGYVLKDVNTVVNAFFCRNLQQMADIARALGKQDEAARYDGMVQKAVAAFNTKLVDPSTGLYIDGGGSSHSSLHANMLPLAFNLVPSERRSKVVAFVKSRGMACSVYGAQYLLESLYQAGEASAALQLLTSESDRGWLNMIHVGATITLEAWDAKYKPNLDWNHAWGGAPANILPRFLLGVAPLTPGFGKAQIRPQPGSLSHVEGTVPTIRGSIQLVWDHPAGKGPALRWSLPGNMLADVQVPPDLATCSPLLDGSAAALSVEGETSWLKGVPSGDHELSCP
ncbi:MAG TPA: alpha-L-rhamnosidase C-terminal domain-containing protein [Polyangiaceae bacterium]|nr:alpha-L-rhamnosidase C-terminal domain-containing protein [Polyangiaceae bacterium]